MIDFISKDRYDISDLIRLVTLLRAPDGCPWDCAQTHLSIRRNFLEEAYEACEGFDRDDPALMREELGDVLLQVLFHTDIERAAGRFTLDDVCDAECKKLIFRHPNLFGGNSAATWEELKQAEKGQKTTAQTLDGVARSLPALWRGEKILKKAAKATDTDESAAQNSDKLDAALCRLRGCEAESAEAQQALGDLLLAVVSLSAAMRLDPEQALHMACERFIDRFAALERDCAQNGIDLREAKTDTLWPK